MASSRVTSHVIRERTPAEAGYMIAALRAENDTLITRLTLPPFDYPPRVLTFSGMFFCFDKFLKVGPDADDVEWLYREVDGFAA